MKNAELISNTINKVGLKLRKYSPEILVVGGVIGVVASAVMACKATTKISAIMEKTTVEIDAIHDCMENETLAEDYSQEDGKKDLAVVYIQTGVKLAKLYAPAVVLGALSITSILASNNILRRRNAAAAAAYATIAKGFKEYRGRVVERFGEEVDHELKYNIKAKKFEETVVDEETGKEKKVKATVDVAELDGYSSYARIFDETCEAWEKDADQNFYFLRAQQNYANDLLRTRGCLFLNDVYRMLSIPITKAGQCVGWVYNPDSPTGDNYVDFGIYNVNLEKVRDFVSGYERSIILDFNVDGVILDLI